MNMAYEKFMDIIEGEVIPDNCQHGGVDCNDVTDYECPCNCDECKFYNSMMDESS